MLKKMDLRVTGATTRLFEMNTKDKNRKENHCGGESEVPDLIKTKETEGKFPQFYNNGDVFRLYVHDISAKTNYFPVSARKLLLFLIWDFTRKNFDSKSLHPKVTLPLEDYYAFRGWENRKKARETTMKDLNLIYSLSIRYHNKKDGNTYDCRILDQKQVPRSGDKLIYIQFSDTFARELKKGGTIAMSTDFLKSKKADTLSLGLKVVSYTSMNKEKANRDSIKLANLIKCCPDLPSSTKVLGEKGSINLRIIQPFLASLDEVTEITGIQFQFQSEFGRPMGREELAKHIRACMVKIKLPESADATAEEVAAKEVAK